MRRTLGRNQVCFTCFSHLGFRFPGLKHPTCTPLKSETSAREPETQNMLAGAGSSSKPRRSTASFAPGPGGQARQQSLRKCSSSGRLIPGHIYTERTSSEATCSWAKVLETSRTVRDGSRESVCRCASTTKASSPEALKSESKELDAITPLEPGDTPPKDMMCCESCI